MATTWKAPTWRMPNEKNQNKFENYGLTFDGGSEYVSTTLTQSGTLSVSCWFYTDDASTQMSFFGAGTTNPYQIRNFGLQNGEYVVGVYTKDLTPNFRGIRYDTTAGSASYTTGQWTHFVGIIEKVTSTNANYYLYENGVLKLQTNDGYREQTTYPFFLGAMNNFGTATQMFNGNISNVTIFDYAISSTQISSLYNSVSPINPMTLKPAPIAYYPLGGNASTGGDATNTLSVPNVAVPDASVFDVSGTDYIKVDNSSSIEPAKNLTVSVWVNWKTGSNTFSYAINKDYNGSNGSYAITRVNQPRFYIFTSTGVVVSPIASSVNLTDTGWHHLVGTYDGSYVRFYVDGEEIGSGTAETGDIIYNTGDLIIGAYQSSGNISPNGEQSNVQIWDTTLSSTEVTTLYNSGVPLTGTQPQAANLKAWYKLDQSANWEADTTGNWQIPDAVSAYPQNFKFDGSNDYIDCGNNSTLNINGDLTISAWVNIDAHKNYNGVVSKISGTDRNFEILFRTTGQMSFYTQTSGGTIDLTTSTTVIPINTWTNIIVTVNSGVTNGTKFYFNGVQDATTGTHTVTANTANLNIGRRTTGGFEMDGLISNVQIFDTALPATGADSVETLYNNGVPLTTAIATDNLKAWYKLDNTEVWSADNTFYTLDKWDIDNNKYPSYFKTALEFNVNEYVSLDLDGTGGSSSVIDSGSDLDLTFSYWVNPNYQNSRGSFKWGTAASSTSDYFINISHGIFPNKWFLNVYNDGTIRIQYDVPTTDIWYHLIVTRTASDNTWRMYVNDALIGSYSDGGTVTAQNYATKLFLGSGRNNSLEGFISNAYIWNTSLSATDRTLLYNNGRPLSDLSSLSAQPFSWWKLDNKTTGVQDSIGSNNGTITGGRVANTLVSTQAAHSSGMTEQNLVNNNVSALNGESSGMTTANLVTSTLTRQVPYNSYSLNFDAASSDYIDCGNDSTFDLNNAFSISTWVKYTSTSAMVVLSKRETTKIGLLIELGSGKPFTAIRDASSNIAITNTYSGTYNDGNWHHVVATFNRTANELKLYVDNELKETANTSSVGDIAPNTNNLMIGRRSDTSSSYFDGKISNISLFNETLTSTEVLKLYNSGVPGDLSSFNPSPISWWSLGSDSYFNGSNWICPDLISTNNGTSANMDDDALIGDAPNSSANGTSTNMSIDANLTGSAPNSSNNSFSVNMSYDDRETSVPS